MRLSASDPDVQTLWARIRDGILDLQPDFQRQEVWSDAKKRRLVDSILRNWHVPPIHVVVDEEGRENVLDGQQRLAAIRDFVSDKIAVDGHVEPSDPEIRRLHGLRYSQLPESVRRQFNRFTVRYYRIEDYQPEEPGELFYRLNQPTNLTTAEQRNAFYGPARKSIKKLLDQLEELGLSSETLGFSNARMAYDDVVARLCFSLNAGRLTEKVTARAITDIYRSKLGFSDASVARASAAIEHFGHARRQARSDLRFNKATLYSWLCFTAALQTPSAWPSNAELLGKYVEEFEVARRGAASEGPLVNVLAVFNDRASSRVSDVSSVLSRDFVLWLKFTEFARANQVPLDAAHPRVRVVSQVNGVHPAGALDLMDNWVLKIISETGWGTHL